MVKVINNGKLYTFKDVRSSSDTVYLDTEEGVTFEFCSIDPTVMESSVEDITRVVLASLSTSLGSNSSLDMQEVLVRVTEIESTIELKSKNIVEDVKEFNVLVKKDSKTFMATRLNFTYDSITLEGKKDSLKLTIEETPFEGAHTVDTLVSLLYLKRAYSRSVLDVNKFTSTLKEHYYIAVTVEEGAVFV